MFGTIKNNKVILALLLYCTIILVGLSGCVTLPAEKAPPAEEPPVAQVSAAIKVKVTSSTWREDKQPYDIYSAAKEKLERAGFKVASGESDSYDATLFIDYEETKGGEYIGGGRGTNIKCSLKLYDKADVLLFEKEILASTSFMVRGTTLYMDAVKDFGSEVYFKYLGEIIATKFGVGDEVSVLITALKDEDSEVRRKATEVLDEIRDTRVVEPLIQALKDEDGRVQSNAAWALGEIGDKRAVEPLIQALKDEDERVRSNAAWALGKIGDERAIEPLTNALEDEDSLVQKAAREALEKIQAAAPTPPSEPPVEVELIKAESEGNIEVTAFGAGSLSSLKLFIISQSDDLLDVAILPGTIFESQAASIQSMVVTTKRTLSVEPHGRVGPISIDAVSINMQLDVADESDSLIVGMTPATGNIMKLLNLAHFQDESSRVQQFAIWTITANPGRNEYAGVSTFGFGSGPSDEEIERIQFLFDEAGIPAKGYRVLQKPVYVELTDAESRGLIDVIVSGENSIDRIQMSIRSKSEDPLEVAILPGTIFAPQAAGVQNMVAIAEKLVLLYPNEIIGPIVIDAACMNMELDVPSEGESLSLSMTPASEDLLKLLDLPDFHEETLRVRQFAIWTITDNPGRSEYVGIGRFVGTGPDSEEIAKIKVLFEKAGIPTDKYKALR